MHDDRGPQLASGTTTVATLVVFLMLAAACAGDGSAEDSPFAPRDSADVTESDAAPTESTPSAAEPVPAPATSPPPETTQVAVPRPRDSTPPTGLPTATEAPRTTGTPECPTSAGRLPDGDEPVRIILDTDFAADVDDAGALAVLHALADQGAVEILAVMVSDAGDAPSHRAVDAINTYYGRPDVPIGVVSGAAPAFDSAYVDALAANFPNDIEDPPAAVDLYREILHRSPDVSVTIVSVGYLTNLDALLSSQPDERSDRSGRQLVAEKVQRWIAMGGQYPDSAEHPFGAEFNFVEDATATLNAVADWPTPAVFSGWEVGQIVLTGAILQDRTPADNPVREAYLLFNGGENRQSWDLTAVLVAVRGTAGLFEVCGGLNVIGAGGSNIWQPAADGPHGYLRLLVPAADVAAVIDQLLIAPPSGS